METSHPLPTASLNFTDSGLTIVNFIVLPEFFGFDTSLVCFSSLARLIQLVDAGSVLVESLLGGFCFVFGLLNVAHFLGVLTVVSICQLLSLPLNRIANLPNLIISRLQLRVDFPLLCLRLQKLTFVVVESSHDPFLLFCSWLQLFF